MGLEKGKVSCQEVSFPKGRTISEQISFGILVPAISELQHASLWETRSQGALGEGRG